MTAWAWHGRTVAYVALSAIGAAILLAQLIAVPRTNPPSDSGLEAPANVAEILHRACYDCHSNATRWPWYSAIAPVSWIVAHHVAAGRRQLNFSEWRSYLPRTRRHKLQWMERALREERMPPWSYRIAHPEARLNDADRTALLNWIESENANLPHQNQRS